MKRTISLILALIFVLCLCACGGNDSELTAMQAQLDALSAQLDNSELEALKDENEELRARIAELEAQLSDAPANIPVEEPTSVSSPESTAEEQIAVKAADGEYPEIVINVVNEFISSEEFSSMQQLYEDFRGTAPSAPVVTKVCNYTIPDFEKNEMDCYLVAVSADVAWWIDESAQIGSYDGGFCLFIDSKTGEYWDSITTDAFNAEHNTATASGRATYLMWIFNNECHGEYEGAYLNDTETKDYMPQSDIDHINSMIG